MQINEPSSISLHQKSYDKFFVLQNTESLTKVLKKKVFVKVSHLLDNGSLSDSPDPTKISVGKVCNITFLPHIIITQVFEALQCYTFTT